MQKHPLILVLLAASGISHAVGLCDDLDADAPPVEYAAMSAPVLQKAAASPSICPFRRAPTPNGSLTKPPPK